MPDYPAFENYITKFLSDQLDPKLTYHGIHHVSNVMDAAMMLASNSAISDKDLLLLKTAILLHDSGFTKTYYDHETESMKIAEKLLPSYGYSKDDIERINGMIQATRIPQVPKNELEEIIADADLEYLGTDRFDEIGESLFKELTAFGFVKSRDQWNQIQVKFISSHSYFTNFCKKFREPEKQKNLERVKQLL